MFEVTTKNAHMQAKRENIIRKIDFISICTESSTKLPAGFGSIIGDLWEIYGLSVALSVSNIFVSILLFWGFI